MPKLFSLESNSFVHRFPAVRLDAPSQGLIRDGWSPKVSPNGAEMLLLTLDGVPSEARRGRDPRGRRQTWMAGAVPHRSRPSLWLAL